MERQMSLSLQISWIFGERNLYHYKKNGQYKWETVVFELHLKDCIPSPYNIG